MPIKRIKLSELKEIVKKIIIEQETNMEIIGKKVSDVFNDYEGIHHIKDKTITYSKLFKHTGEDFSAINMSRNYLGSEGYDMGSMQRDYPIAFMINGKTGVNEYGNTVITTKYGEERPLIVTKFDKLNQDNWDTMDGALLSKDFREGDVHVIFFIFPD
jgi:hypothetical protein